MSAPNLAHVQMRAMEVLPYVLPIPKDRVAYFFGIMIMDASGPRPYIEDADGRRWMVDESGEVA